MATDISITTMNGRLVKDAELRYTPNGTAVLSFTVANNRSFKKGEEWKTDVLFLDCVAWSDYAEKLNGKLTKGMLVSVSGRLKQENWTDKDSGKDMKKISLTIQSVQKLSKPGEGATQSEGAGDVQGGDNLNEDDISF